MKSYNPALKPFSRNLRSNMTDAEQLLWSKLRRKQILGLQFYRQKPLANYIVDFYCAAANLVIELDGSQHFEADHQVKDEERDRVLESMGIVVLRFDNRQVLTELDAVMSVVFNAVEKQIPPNPPFTKGGVIASSSTSVFDKEQDSAAVQAQATPQTISPFEKEEVFTAVQTQAALQIIPPFEKGEAAEAVQTQTALQTIPPFEKGGQGGFSKKGNSA
ncbi:endonuclease domain-containing protein [Methylobacter sp.]|uniref:endonuclease domain-containing protein n=1 Tax=Methylobacter sp. TaxID=2051955 RepID=UPI0011FCE6EE|nr:endonuclease domain-containing protein [Methylobacter sp.]TAK63624.1 MAG: endonuclease domain-containing protein [Methylobacter sp.]